ncbi:MAG: type II toxin-antitoxin system VapC family toxin [Dermatophilaceae bacterium]
MNAYFVDPSVLLYALGDSHPLRTACRAILDGAASGRMLLHLSVEGGQEFLFHRLRRIGPEGAVADFDDVDAFAVWHPFDVGLLRDSRTLVAQGHVRGRDAVHAATAIRAGFDSIVSPDRDFDGIPGLRRIDPRDLT